MRKIENAIVEGTVRGRMDSPVGVLTILAEGSALSAILFDTDLSRERNRIDLDDVTDDDRHPVIRETKRQLSEYFAGNRTEFDIPLVMHGTPFQLQVWNRLREIPYGETVSYQDQARKVGDIKKVRAVAAANGRNPISIIVPCHRVIGKNGDLTGFGGGLARKRLLLDLESRRRTLAFG